MKKQINCVAPLSVLIALAERSEVAVPKAMKEAIRPDPEVVVRAQRRPFTAGYTKRMLAGADSTHEPGSIGALIQREAVRQQSDQLTQGLARAELIIEVQKQVSSLLGISLASVDPTRAAYDRCRAVRPGVGVGRRL